MPSGHGSGPASGFPLFTRTTRGIELTFAGRQLYEEAGRRIARQLGEAAAGPTGVFFHPEGGHYSW
ncbi:hypothetical protein ACFZDG_07725 [Kitasatospora xanthocidica]|uniref:hypothetical protein n=1 Tax=Kitasatospora xanthocidica TaxID=83382 RepID=UPI0036F07E75